MNTTLTQTHQQTGYKNSLAWLLSSAYGLACLLFIANFYSFGVFFSFPFLFLSIACLGPLFGFATLLFHSFLLKVTGSWLGGRSDPFSLRIALAFAKAPVVLLLGMWMGLSVFDCTMVFIQDVVNGPSVIIVFSTLLVSLWSFFLLIKHLRTLQGFTFARAFCNASIAQVLLVLIYTTLLFIGRYIYISAF